jgi:hypothetical protein
MNARTQITMDPELQRRAHAKAAELGLSFAEYVRRLVAHDLGEPKRKADISLLFDLGASREPTDVARDKDKMLGEALWNEHLRKTGGKTAGKPRRRSRTGTSGP